MTAINNKNIKRIIKRRITMEIAIQINNILWMKDIKVAHLNIAK